MLTFPTTAHTRLRQDPAARRRLRTSLGALLTQPSMNKRIARIRHLGGCADCQSGPICRSARRIRRAPRLFAVRRRSPVASVRTHQSRVTSDVICICRPLRTFAEHGRTPVEHVRSHQRRVKGDVICIAESVERRSPVVAAGPTSSGVTQPSWFR